MGEASLHTPGQTWRLADEEQQTPIAKVLTMRLELGGFLMGIAFGIQFYTVKRALWDGEAADLVPNDTAARDSLPTALDRDLPLEDHAWSNRAEVALATTDKGNEQGAPSERAEPTLPWDGIEWGRQPIRELRVHRDAPIWLRQAAVDAAREWCRWDQSLCLQVKVVDQDENVIIEPELEKHAAAGYASWSSWGDRPVLLIVDREQAPDSIGEILAHEVGHGLCGCAGHLQNRGLMADGEVAIGTRATASDVEMVRHFRALSLAESAQRMEPGR
jgi:hypothetical protein